MKTANRLKQFPEYVFARFNKVIAQVENTTGKEVLNFGIGSPDFPPSKKYTEKLKELIDDPKAHLYPGYKANKNFTDALISWYKKRFNVELSENELLPLLGAKDGTSHLPLAIADTGDEVLVPDPGYPGFSGPLLMYGIQPVFYDLFDKNDFKIDFESLEKLISPKTRAMWVNFPSNPTGQIATKEELEKIISFAKEKNILVIYDHAYSEITFDGFIAPSILEVNGAKEVAVELGSFSKMFSFAGNRMGWLVGNNYVITALAQVKSQLDSGMYSPLQNLGAYALNNIDTKWHEQMINSYKHRRDIIAEKLQKLGMTFSISKGSLYIWAKIPENISSEEYVLKMLQEKQVFFAPGSAFGSNGEGYVRVSICANIDDIDKYL